MITADQWDLIKISSPDTNFPYTPGDSVTDNYEFWILAKTPITFDVSDMPEINVRTAGIDLLNTTPISIAAGFSQIYVITADYISGAVTYNTKPAATNIGASQVMIKSGAASGRNITTTDAVQGASTVTRSGIVALEPVSITGYGIAIRIIIPSSSLSLRFNGVFDALVRLARNS